jgi:hypothetical protein
MTDAQISALFTSLTRVIANATIEVQTLMAVTVLYSPAAALAIAPTRKAVREKWQPFLDSLGQSTPETLVDMLQKFEGSVQ